MTSLQDSERPRYIYRVASVSEDGKRFFDGPWAGIEPAKRDLEKALKDGYRAHIQRAAIGRWHRAPAEEVRGE